MNEQIAKLTGRVASRYDRSITRQRHGSGGQNMSEAATAELLEKINPAVYESWAKDLAGAESPGEREGIWAAIRSGVSKNQQDVKKMADDEVKKITDSMSDKESKERKRSKTEKDVDEFVKSLQSKEEMRSSLKGPSHPPESFILRDRKGAQLKEWGWGTEDQELVKTKLREKLRGQHSLNENQIKNTIELLIATGKPATEISQIIDSTPADFEPTDEELRNARGSRETAISYNKLAWFGKLQIKEKYLQRFVLQEEFAEQNEQDYQHTDPSNIEEIAWQVMHHYGDKTWGPNGTFPLLEMRIGYEVDKKGKMVPGPDGKPKIDPDRSKYYINQSNFVRWARERMWNIYDINNDVGDFVSAINLPKTYGAMDFGRMFPEYTKYFASEDGVTNYWLMAQELIVECVGFQSINQMASTYQQEMRDPDKLQEAIGKMFLGNSFTKETFRKNLLELMTIMPLNYEGNKPGELMKNDGILGAAMMDMFLAYYNLSDFDELQKLLGKGSSFFTKDGYMLALQTVVEDKVTESSGESNPTVLNAETQAFLDKAFDKNGQISTEENKNYFIKLINFFGQKVNNEDAEYTVRRMLYRVVSEKYGRVVREEVKDEHGNAIKDADGNVILKDAVEKVFVDGEEHTVKKYGLTSDVEGTKDDTWSLRMAWVGAKAMARVFGAGARNDTEAQGYDGMTKMHLVEIYRNKMMNKNADEHGNPYTIHQFKILAMDPFNAMVTESFKEVVGNDGKVTKRAKTVMEVLREMNSTMTAYTARLKQMEADYDQTEEGPVKEQKLAVLNKFRDEKNDKYQNKAGELTFKARAMSNYYDDHLMRAHETYKLIQGAKEVKMESYVTYDAWGGVGFNREKFQEDLQHKVIHPIRYFLNTYPDINYNQKFRMLDQAATIHARHHSGYDVAPIYRDMTLGEAMFGHEMLNREQFWLRDKNGKPIEMRDKNGRKAKGIYEIDYDKVNSTDGKKQLWKQFFMTKIAADLHSHRAFHSADNRFDINYYNNVLKAIESIPIGVGGDEFSIRDQTRDGNFFDKKDMKWFKKSIKVENYNLFLRAVFKDLLMPDEKQEGIGLLLFFSLAAREIVRREG
ncbi:MAG TPA: hypothetical protein VM077_00010 [Candidatus Limnocylindrales bacterium]|nr:hypothetical protein [Candidatus Limnocylindrales bacterium]